VLPATLTPDVVIRSPVSARLRFEGIEDARELFGMVFGELTYTDEFADADTRILVYRGRLAGQQIEELAGVAARFAPRLARLRYEGRSPRSDEPHRCPDREGAAVQFRRFGESGTGR
jgi:hypothetical protein